MAPSFGRPHLRPPVARSLVMGILERLSVKSKLQTMLVGASLISVFAIALVCWWQSRSTIERTISNQLRSMRVSRSRQIESYLEDLRNHISTLSEERTIVSAMVKFNRSHRSLRSASVRSEWDAAIAKYYKEQYLPALAENVEGTPDFQTYRPKGQAERYLKYHYIANNPLPLGRKEGLDGADDGSDYSRYHHQFHPLLRNIVQKFGYYDLFLIDFKTREVVYSVTKEPDFITNLAEGPYRNSNLAEVVAAVRENPDRDAVRLVDFEPYRPSLMAPAAFFAAPIYNGPHIVGILAVQLPVNEINKALTGDRNWEKDGLGKSGDIFLVGADYRMRSISRFLLEDKENYLKALRSLGEDEGTLRLIERLNTSILLQTADNQGIRKALEKGEEVTTAARDYRGTPVLGSYAPLRIDGVKWAIAAEISRAEAYQPVRYLEISILVTTLILVFLITWWANFSANRFVLPILQLIRGTRQVSEGDLSVRLERAGRDEFARLTNDFNQMVAGIRQQRSIIEQQNRENEALIANILPRGAIERYRRGEELVVDSIQQATVLVSRIAGLAELTATQKARESAATLNELVVAFDKAAEERDVERHKIVGDTYVAVCGLTAPHLDHDKRALDFASIMVEIIRGFNSRNGTHLALHAGVRSGPIVAGIVGKNKFSYSLWGQTVNEAFYLCDAARPNTIAITTEIYKRLKDFYAFIAFERNIVTHRQPEKDLEIWLLPGNEAAKLESLDIPCECIDDEPGEEQLETNGRQAGDRPTDASQQADNLQSTAERSLAKTERP